jgi:hypothetical protein
MAGIFLPLYVYTYIFIFIGRITLLFKYPVLHLWSNRNEDWRKYERINSTMFPLSGLEPSSLLTDVQVELCIEK